MRIVGITGGIGSGKSSVLKLIESKNITKINSDQIVNNLLRVDSKVIKFCKINFDVHIDQSTKNFAKNKNKLANILFTDLEALNKFEKFIWPIALQQVEKNIKKENITLI